MSPAKGLIIIGVALAALGTVWQLAPWTVSWFGRLPGDIRIEGKNTFVFIPLASMLIVSIVLSVLVRFFRS